MATEDDLSKYNHFQVVRGFPFPLPYPSTGAFTKKNIEDAIDYVPRDNDLIIASYPKTGTTWLQYIVMQVVSKASVFHSFEDLTYKIYPYMEMAGIDVVEALTGDRTYKHHMPYSLVQKNPKSKCIYTYRHPEDTLVSYYHFYNSLDPAVPLTFEQFYRYFVDGLMPYGSYFRHVLSFYEHHDDPNLLMVSYEKLHADRRKEVLRIAKFLGEDHHAYLVEHEEVLEKVMEHTSFEYMKNNLSLTKPKDRMKEEKGKVNFFRKGVVGDGKSMLSEEQRERIKEAAGILKGTAVFKEWYPEDN